MIWGLEDFVDLGGFLPSFVFGQLDIVCEHCNCSYEAEFEDGKELFECPNCQQLQSVT